MRVTGIVAGVSVLAAVLLAGCGLVSRSDTHNPRLYQLGSPTPKGGGRYALGLSGHGDDQRYDRVGFSVWYGAEYHGRRTANGEIYDINRLTAAHPTLPLPSLIEVTNLQNGRKLILRANDRGPQDRGRILYASKRAARMLGFHNAGRARVRVRYLGEAPLNGDDAFEEGFARQQARRWPPLARNHPASRRRRTNRPRALPRCRTLRHGYRTC